MTRKKRSRTTGMSDQVVTVKTRTQHDLDGLQRKKDRKRKGLKSGSRHSMVTPEDARKAAQRKDPRHGSKKAIPLIVEPKKPMTKQQRRMTAEQELQMLENDAQLMILLDRIEAGEKLGAGLQKQVDQKLDRIEQLMNQLGLLDEDEPEMDEEAVSGPRSDDDLLDQFENMEFDGLDKE
ncbi:Der GTPase-activating protein YihI [Photobacterium rosenbergii]|uniref:Der GTPase-activating protein YihI n=1 Tax=Photobacterium rosenbergii TaxID=294936 RepID=A0ABU3ZQ84_9GAMM|nr:Der GTPase-activating protein YihI [Photobacterium rosenbergii]MDV5172262.1 Der GTPase-activating protein YihI [Photobacterium rosenbergii]